MSGGTPAAVAASVLYCTVDIEMYSTKIPFSRPTVLLKSLTTARIGSASRPLHFSQ